MPICPNRFVIDITLGWVGSVEQGKGCTNQEQIDPRNGHSNTTGCESGMGNSLD